MLLDAEGIKPEFDRIAPTIITKRAVPKYLKTALLEINSIKNMLRLSIANT